MKTNPYRHLGLSTRLGLIMHPFIFAGLAIAFLSIQCFGQSQYKSGIDYDKLASEYGTGLKDGSGIRVFHVEAFSGGYMPDLNNPEFMGKTFTNATVPPNAAPSTHATNVGKVFYGNTVSIAPGITDVTGANADDFVNRFTGYSSAVLPLAQGYHVSNHSYIGDDLGLSQKISLLRRFDYIVNRDDTVAVVGANNGDSLTAPDLWSHSYNAITVGRSDGLHSHGTTTDYGAGRNIVQIVVPMQSTGLNFTSFATPVVSASAAVLKEAAGFDGGGNSLAGGHNETIRAMLFAGATKSEFASWDKTATRPIDDVYGFGELNIYNSYKIQEAGQFGAFKAGDDPSLNLGELGWDFGKFDGADLYYNFEIANGRSLLELSAALVWNVSVNAGSGAFPSHQLANLNLELFGSNDVFLGSLLQSSNSTAYNFEHIYLTNPLAAGKYTFRISGNVPVDYGFAWRMNFGFAKAPEPSSLVLLVLGCTALFQRRITRRTPE